MADDSIVLDGFRIQPSCLEQQSNDAFSSTHLLLCKPKWIPDDSVSNCHQCQAKFTAVRRKHHCRHCGQVFCSMCCRDKILIAYMSYPGPERVCEQCRPYIQIMVTATSKNLSSRLQAVEAIHELCKHSQGIKEVLECGGVHALVSLCKNKHRQLQGRIAQCFHALSVHPNLHPFLVEVGTIKAITRVLADVDSTEDTLFTDCLGLLTLFCRNTKIKPRVIQEGALLSVLQLCSSSSDTLCLMALQCVSLLCDSDQASDIVVNCEDKHYLTKILALVRSKDEQAQEVSLRTLANISCCSDYHRQRILQEEVFSGGCIAQCLQSQPKNVQVLVNAACLVANLANTENTQGGLQDHLQALCELCSKHQCHARLLHHCARGLTNFSNFKHNAQILIRHLSYLIPLLLQSDSAELQHYGFLITVALMEHMPVETLDVLKSHGTYEFLRRLSQQTQILRSLQSALHSTYPTLVKPDT